VRETSRGYAAATVVPAAVANLVSRLDGLLSSKKTGARAATDARPFVQQQQQQQHQQQSAAKEEDVAISKHDDPFAKAVFEDIALPAELEAQLLRVAVGAANTRRHRAPFRHALLHRPPGTGKTLFAKRLAQCAGMDYAIASGGDVAPLGRDAVTSLHKLFDGAHTSPRGLLLLVDEAEAFVRSRSLAGSTMSEDARNALNAFLYRTGSQNTDVLVVFASNAPELFDAAVLDHVVHFALPAYDQRLAIIAIELRRYVHDCPVLAQLTGGLAAGRVVEGRNVVLDDAVTAADFEAAARQTEGFSGSEVSKRANAWRAADLDGAHPKLTAPMIRDVTTSQLHQTSVK